MGQPADRAGRDPAKDVLDQGETLARLEDDAGLMRELVEVFLQESPRLMADIQRSVDSGDGARLELAAHTLKGAITNFAAPRAFEAAFKLEKIGRSGVLADHAEATCRELEDEMDQLEAALAALGREYAL